MIGSMTMMTTDTCAREIIELLVAEGATVATAESLTGGALCSALVDNPGASQVVRGGVCTYATPTKASILGVDSQLLDSHGPVDPEVARQMADGARRLYGSDYACSTTGVAGPGPADGHDAGTVYIACSSPRGSQVRRENFSGERDEVRQQSVRSALLLLREILKAEKDSSTG